jgi:hypothetical protein
MYNTAYTEKFILNRKEIPHLTVVWVFVTVVFHVSHETAFDVIGKQMSECALIVQLYFCTRAHVCTMCYVRMWNDRTSLRHCGSVSRLDANSVGDSRPIFMSPLM